MPKDLDELNELLEQESASVRRAFRKFVRQVKSPSVLGDIVEQLRAGSINGAMGVMEDYIREFSDELPKSFVRSARDEMRRITPTTGATTVSFDAGDPVAAGLMRENQFSFVKDFTDRQRDSVRAALADSLDRGDGERATARTIKSSIGLTENQYKAVDNYRSMLERNSAEALNRDLRDKRQDGTIQGAIDRGDVLSDSQIDRMVSRYEDNYIDYRARTIARTETHRVVSRARREAWRQLSKKHKIKGSRFVRTWNTTMDGRERDTHEEMNGQVRRGLNTPYKSPTGEEIMYPGDPDASAEEVIGCRCVETVEIE